MSVECSKWAELFHDEYLGDFVPSGGSTVKLLVADHTDTQGVLDQVERCAQAAGLMAVGVDSGRTRVHAVDAVFHHIASQIPWLALAEKWMRSNLEEAGLFVPEGLALSETQAIAEESRLDPRTVKTTVNRIITNRILHDNTLWGEFRRAIACLCVSCAVPANVGPNSADTILQWLNGEKTPLPELKRLGIYQRIGRHNARPMLVSLARWLRRVGYSGLCVSLDLSAVFRKSDEGIKYTRQALLEMYEMIRQFIDETDRTDGLVVVCVSGPGMLDDPERDYRLYDAFMLRVVNDVRDRAVDNPLNVLVRIAPIAAREGGAR